MEQTSMQGEHEDARDDCSCHSSTLARGPEWGSGGVGWEEGWKLLAWLCVGFLSFFSVREKKKKKKGCPGVYCISISSGINDKKYNTFHNVIHLGNVPGPKPISKSLPFSGVTSALHLIYHFLFPAVPSIFLPTWMIYTYSATHLSLFPHLDSSAVSRYAHRKGLGAKTSEMDPGFCHTLTAFVKFIHNAWPSLHMYKLPSVPLNFLLLLSFYVNFFPHGGAVIILFPATHAVIKYWCLAAAILYLSAWHTCTLMHIYYIWPVKANLNWRRVIFWPAVFVFFDSGSSVWQIVALLSHAAKIWNWRIIVSAGTVAACSTILWDVRIPLTSARPGWMRPRCRGKGWRSLDLEVFLFLLRMNSTCVAIFVHHQVCIPPLERFQLGPLPSVSKAFYNINPLFETRLGQNSDKNGPLCRNIVGVMLSGLPVAIWALRWTGGSAWEHRRGGRAERERDFVGRKKNKGRQSVEEGRSLRHSLVCWMVARRTGGYRDCAAIKGHIIFYMKM